MNSRIYTHSAWLLSAQVLIKVISFFYTVYLARILGVEQFGLYTIALAYFSLFSAMTDFGFNRFLIREGARDHQRLADFLHTVVITRITLIACTFAIFSLLLYWLDSNMSRVSISLLALLAVFPQSTALTFDAALVAKEKIKYSAIGLLILSIANAIVGFLLVSSGAGATGAVVSLSASHLVYTGILMYFLMHHQIRFWSKVSTEQMVIILKGSLPYGILGILGLLYFRLDALLLGYLKGSYEAGIYGAAYRFLEAVVFMPSALATALFPVLSRLHDQNSDELKQLYFSALKTVGMASLGVLIIFMTILPGVIRVFLPHYEDSISVLRILSLTIPFMFLHVIGTIVLLSTEKLLKSVIYLSVGMVAFNIIMNLIFIPSFSYYGAAYVTVISEALSFVVFFSLIYYKILRHG